MYYCNEYDLYNYVFNMSCCEFLKWFGLLVVGLVVGLIVGCIKVFEDDGVFFVKEYWFDLDIKFVIVKGYG